MKKTISKIISSLLILSMVITSSNSYAYPTLFKTKSHAQRYLEDEKDLSAVVIDSPSAVSIAQKLGRIVEYHKGKSGSLVIHIQDRHADPVCQHNIAGIIDEFVSKYNTALICLEGASKELDTSFYDGFPDNSIKRKTSEFFLDKGIFTGAEFYKIANKDKYIRAQGVEDKKAYLQHLSIYRSNGIDKDQILGLLKAISASLNSLKEEAYSRDLRGLDKAAASYHIKEIKLPEYLKELGVYSKKARYDISGYENLSGFIELVKKEERVDFKKAEEQREAVIEELSGVLGEVDLDALIDKSLEFRTGKITQEEFYDYLYGLMEKEKIDLSKYRDLTAYVDYIRFSKGINHLAVFDEADEAEEAIKLALCNNDIQRDLVLYSKAVDVLKDLYTFKLTHRQLDYMEAKNGFFDISKIQRFLRTNSSRYGLSLNSVVSEAQIDQYALDRSKRYYQVALKRDIALIDNTLDRMDRDRKDKAILITGGFHTDGITSILKEKDISYVVICPNIGAGDYEEVYAARMAGKLPDITELAEFFHHTLVAPLITADMSRTETVGQVKTAFAALVGLSQDKQWDSLGWAEQEDILLDIWDTLAQQKEDFLQLADVQKIITKTITARRSTEVEDARAKSASAGQSRPGFLPRIALGAIMLCSRAGINISAESINIPDSHVITLQSDDETLSDDLLLETKEILETNFSLFAGTDISIETIRESWQITESAKATKLVAQAYERMNMPEEGRIPVFFFTAEQTPLTMAGAHEMLGVIVSSKILELDTEAAILTLAPKIAHEGQHLVNKHLLIKEAFEGLDFEETVSYVTLLDEALAWRKGGNPFNKDYSELDRASKFSVNVGDAFEAFFREYHKKIGNIAFYNYDGVKRIFENGLAIHLYSMYSPEDNFWFFYDINTKEVYIEECSWDIISNIIRRQNPEDTHEGSVLREAIGIIAELPYSTKQKLGIESIEKIDLDYCYPYGDSARVYFYNREISKEIVLIVNLEERTVELWIFSGVSIREQGVEYSWELIADTIQTQNAESGFKHNDLAEAINIIAELPDSAKEELGIDDLDILYFDDYQVEGRYVRLFLFDKVAFETIALGINLEEKTVDLLKFIPYQEPEPAESASETTEDTTRSGPSKTSSAGELREKLDNEFKTLLTTSDANVLAMSARKIKEPFLFMERTSREGRNKIDEALNPFLEKYSVSLRTFLKEAKEGKKLAWVIKLPVSYNALVDIINMKNEWGISIFGCKAVKKYMYLELGSQYQKHKFHRGAASSNVLASLADTAGHVHPRFTTIESSSNDKDSAREDDHLRDVRDEFILMYNGDAVEMSVWDRIEDDFIKIRDESQVIDRLVAFGLLKEQAGTKKAKTSSAGQALEKFIQTISGEAEVISGEIELPFYNFAKHNFEYENHKKAFEEAVRNFIATVPVKLKVEKTGYMPARNDLLEIILREALYNAYDAIASFYDDNVLIKPPKGYIGEITISFQIKGGNLIITIFDNNGGERSAKTVHKRARPEFYFGQGGNAISNIEEYLEPIGGSFKLDFKEVETRAITTIPLDKLGLKEKAKEAKLLYPDGYTAFYEKASSAGQEIRPEEVIIQGEYMIIDGKQENFLAGVIGVTACAILIPYDEVSKVGVMAHLDAGNAANFESFTKLFKDLEESGADLSRLGIILIGAKPEDIEDEELGIGSQATIDLVEKGIWAFYAPLSINTPEITIDMKGRSRALKFNAKTGKIEDLAPEEINIITKDKNILERQRAYTPRSQSLTRYIPPKASSAGMAIEELIRPITGLGASWSQYLEDIGENPMEYAFDNFGPTPNKYGLIIYDRILRGAEEERNILKALAELRAARGSKFEIIVSTTEGRENLIEKWGISGDNIRTTEEFLADRKASFAGLSENEKVVACAEILRKQMPVGIVASPDVYADKLASEINSSREKNEEYVFVTSQRPTDVMIDGYKVRSFVVSEIAIVDVLQKLKDYEQIVIKLEKLSPEQQTALLFEMLPAVDENEITDYIQKLQVSAKAASAGA